jgi:hypothetical protein
MIRKSSTNFPSSSTKTEYRSKVGLWDVLLLTPDVKKHSRSKYWHIVAMVLNRYRRPFQKQCPWLVWYGWHTSGMVPNANSRFFRPPTVRASVETTASKTTTRTPRKKENTRWGPCTINVSTRLWHRAVTTSHFVYDIYYSPSSRGPSLILSCTSVMASQSHCSPTAYKCSFALKRCFLSLAYPQSLFRNWVAPEVDTETHW